MRISYRILSVLATTGHTGPYVGYGDLGLGEIDIPYYRIVIHQKRAEPFLTLPFSLTTEAVITYLLTLQYRFPKAGEWVRRSRHLFWGMTSNSEKINKLVMPLETNMFYCLNFLLLTAKSPIIPEPRRSRVPGIGTTLST